MLKEQIILILLCGVKRKIKIILDNKYIGARVLDPFLKNKYIVPEFKSRLKKDDSVRSQRTRPNPKEVEVQ